MWRGVELSTVIMREVVAKERVAMLESCESARTTYFSNKGYHRWGMVVGCGEIMSWPLAQTEGGGKSQGVQSQRRHHHR